VRIATSNDFTDTSALAEVVNSRNISSWSICGRLAAVVPLVNSIN
jgi:hypothetical protein